jgi:hypothetical protein
MKGLIVNLFIVFFVPFSVFAQSRDIQAEGQKPSAPPTVGEIFEQSLKRTQVDPSEEERRENLKIVLSALTSKEARIRQEAEFLLNSIARKNDVPLLVRTLKEVAPDTLAQSVIAKVLGAQGDPSAVEAMRYEFQQGDAILQRAIVEGLSGIRDESSISLLSLALGETYSRDVHIAAISSLGRIGGNQSQYVLANAKKLRALPSEEVALDWAKKTARGEITPDRTDEEYQEGSPNTLFFKGSRYMFYRPVPRTSARNNSKTSSEQPEVDSNKNNPWLLVCIHGSDLLTEDTFRSCQLIAKIYKLALLVPFFDPLQFPHYDTLNLEGKRADHHLLELIDFVSKKAKIKKREVYLFGFEKGGDFVQRMIFTYPHIIARGAFYSTLPLQLDDELSFPLGMRDSPLAPDLHIDLERVVKSDFAVLVDTKQIRDRAYRDFFSNLVDYCDSNELISRIRRREISDKDATLVGSWDVSQKYLFPAD